MLVSEDRQTLFGTEKALLNMNGRPGDRRQETAWLGAATLVHFRTRGPNAAG